MNTIEKESMKGKIETLRNQIKNESMKLIKESYETGKCANCGKDIPENRRKRKSYTCSNECNFDFFTKHDYTQHSPILRTLRAQLKVQRPKKEQSPWSMPVARKEYLCVFCGLRIDKGEKHDKYTVLPGEESFIDDPYGAYRYHRNCLSFTNKLTEIGWLDEDGYTERDLTDTVHALSMVMGTDREIAAERIRDVSAPDDAADELIARYGDLENFSRMLREKENGGGG